MNVCSVVTVAMVIFLIDIYNCVFTTLDFSIILDEKFTSELRYYLQTEIYR